MLVPSMTLAEIRKEIGKDYPIVKSKGKYLMDEIIHESRTRHNERIVRYFDYYSKYKNNWIICLDRVKKISMMCGIAYYYGNAGLVAVAPTANNDNMLTYYTAHFFKRFNERLKLDICLPNDIIKEYLSENYMMNFIPLDYFQPGMCKIFCATKRGYILGTCDENQMFYKMNTFITHDMLKGNQMDTAKYLNGLLEKYKINAANLQ